MTKYTNKHLDSIIDNAFDFLDMAIDKFDSKSLKYSIIHFSTAVELILKARLVHEHWSLIVADKPDINKFKTGEFRSITINESIEKIKNVLDEDFSKNNSDSFISIAKHRNKVIHFFHSEINQESVAREQCLGWYYLSSLIQKWNDIFFNYKKKLTEYDNKMRKHYSYLLTLYEQIKPDIIKKQKAGTIFNSMPLLPFYSF